MEDNKDKKDITENQVDNKAEAPVNNEAKGEESEKGYKRVDVEGGYLTNKDEITYFKAIQRRDLLNNFMLGDFNSKGDYVLKEPLMRELVVMKKYLIDSFFNNVYFVRSTMITNEVGALQFCVMVKTSKDSNKATAILKLLEPVNKAGGYIQNTNSFTVATYTDDNDDYFLSKVKKVFNIYPVEDGITQNEEEVAEIMARLAARSRAKFAAISKLAVVDKKHYDDRIEALKAGGFDGVLEELNALMKKAGVFIDPSNPNYYKVLNDLMDQAVDNYSRKHPEMANKVRDALAKSNREYAENMQNTAIENKQPAPTLDKKVEQEKPKEEEQAKSKPKANDKAKPAKAKAKAKGKDKAAAKKAENTYDAFVNAFKEIAKENTTPTVNKEGEDPEYSKTGSKKESDSLVNDILQRSNEHLENKVLGKNEQTIEVGKNNDSIAPTQKAEDVVENAVTEAKNQYKEAKSNINTLDRQM